MFSARLEGKKVGQFSTFDTSIVTRAGPFIMYNHDPKGLRRLVDPLSINSLDTRPFFLKKNIPLSTAFAPSRSSAM